MSERQPRRNNQNPVNSSDGHPQFQDFITNPTASPGSDSAKPDVFAGEEPPEPQAENASAPQQNDAAPSDRKKGRKARPKSEMKALRERMFEDIRTNGPRTILELAVKYDVTEAWVGQEVGGALVSGELPRNSPLAYTSMRAKSLTKWQRDRLKLSDDALVRIEGDKDSLTITAIK